ncbi:MAG: serine hydroxymethyltransferase [Aigarchaeota archaeon]|nr:serine hydroxymethyltransferase [Aigarchaeota archaeon]MDW8021974.1 serine hydroxymethyltransferase [Nitrososphaerota archaeon]
MSGDDELDNLLKLVRLHNTWRGKECINLIASENVTSPLVDAVYFSDAMHRYAEGLPFKRFYQGTKYVDEIEDRVSRIFAELFKARYSDIRAVSGTIANATTFAALAKGGDEAAVIPLPGGAHVSHSKYGILGRLGLQPVEVPIIPEELGIDPEGAVKLIRERSPKIVVLGASVIIFHQPVKEISEAASEVGAKVIFDAAHILGLIAGQVYPNPLAEGADVITTSTHKTFPGPQGGAILTSSEEIYEKIAKIVFPVFVSNHHLHRLAALGVTALEMKKFGKSYAAQIVKNARKLAEELHSRGFKVLGEGRGFTETHQVLLDVKGDGGGARVAESLEEANIIVNKNILPWDKPSDIANPSGIRIGVQEVTRWGMSEGDMIEVAEFIYRVVKRRDDPNMVREDVIRFRKEFTRIHYTFDVDVKRAAEEIGSLLSR